MPIYKHENQRAWEHMQTEKQLAIERRRVEIEMERLKLQEAALAFAPYEDSSYGSEGTHTAAGGMAEDSLDPPEIGSAGPRKGWVALTQDRNRRLAAMTPRSPAAELAREKAPAAGRRGAKPNSASVRSGRWTVRDVMLLASTT